MIVQRTGDLIKRVSGTELKLLTFVRVLLGLDFHSWTSCNQNFHFSEINKD